MLTLALHGERQIVEYKYPWGIYRVSFNPSQITRSELDEWVKLSPTLGAYNEFLIPENIELCKAGDNRYKGCGQENTSFTIENARVNLSSIASRIHVLQSQHYPSDLEPVVSFAISIQEFWLQRGTQELDFLTHGDETALEQKIGLIDPSNDCRPVLEQIRNTQEKDRRDQLVRFDWVNCVWFSERDKLGPYPEKDWKTFLAAHDITEEIIEESPD
jgi:hypothetical protein